MKIILFGSTNPSGAAFLELSDHVNVEVWGRSAPSNFTGTFIYCDLHRPCNVMPNALNGVIISFAPVWVLASFIEKTYNDSPDHLVNLGGIIACSSSSYLTKRFAFSDYDKQLAANLKYSHNILVNICCNLNLPCKILAPTLVYGKINSYTDKNISKVVNLMGRFPFIILPRTTGLRQPIHAIQLAHVAYAQYLQIQSLPKLYHDSSIIPLGGDTILTYKEMIVRVIQVLDSGHSAKQCKILCVPDKLYLLIIFPFLFINLKLFEALLRVRSDLSDFPMAHSILSTQPQEFPLRPFFDKD